LIPRHIIRPRGIYSTPLNLKEALGAKRTIAYPWETRYRVFRRPSWLQDFFLTYPPAEELEEHVLLRNSTQRNLCSNEQRSRESSAHSGQSQQLDLYRIARAFTVSSKPSQRQQLASDAFPTPPTARMHQDTRAMVQLAFDAQYPSRTYIVRPLRHSRGEGWRTTEDPTDFIEGQEYIQAVYPKNHEYRVIAVRGEPLITLLKRVPEGFPRSQPWNHSNGSSFVTVNDLSLDRLRHTNVYDLIRSSKLLQSIDLAGIDIMYRRENEYAVTEVNLCPSLQIPPNLEKVSRYVRSLPERC
jgi:hypothetical protein